QVLSSLSRNEHLWAHLTRRASGPASWSHCITFIATALPQIIILLRIIRELRTGEPLTSSEAQELHFLFGGLRIASFEWLPRSGWPLVRQRCWCEPCCLHAPGEPLL